MKTRLLGALVGLAISFAVPTFAQQKETIDPQLIQKLDTINKKYNEAVNNHDAAAFGALYTEDAIFLTIFGPVYGLKAIEKWFEDGFKVSQPKNNTATTDPRSVRMLGPDNLTYNVDWSETDKGKNGEDVPIKGYCTVVATRQGDAWKICALTWNLTPPPAPAETNASPTSAQEKGTVDPEVRQQIEAVHMKFVEAQNKGDAAALAALFTQDAVQLWYGLSEGGLASGQQAIEKRYKATFAAPTPIDSKILQIYPIGNDICVTTEYKVPMWKGHAVTIYGRDADTWKIRMVYSN